MPLYTPLFLMPDNTYRDMSVNQAFTCEIDARGSQVTKYRVRIYNNTSGTLLYDTNDVTLSTPLSDGQTVNMTIPANSVANNLQLKWTVEYKNATETVTSFETFFQSATNAVISISVPATITSQQYTFIGTYTQAQGISYNFWWYEFYDSNNNLLLKTDDSPSYTISYLFSGFLSGVTYKIRAFASLPDGSEIQSALYTFNVTYATPEIETKPTATNNCDLNAVDVSWGGIKQITGVVTGAYTYTNNFMSPNNYGLNLANGSTLTYSSLDIPSAETAHMVWSPLSNSFDGSIFKLSNSSTGEYIEVGYDTGVNSFYKKVNDNTSLGVPILAEVGDIFLFFLQFNRVYLYKYNSSLQFVSSQIL